MTITTKELYELWREMQNQHFAKSSLAPWESLGQKHKVFWAMFAARLDEIWDSK